MSNNILHIHSIQCDFKKLRGVTVHFSDAMTAIRGPNGAGKSSVLHAILFALYGVSAVPGGKAVAIPTGAKDASVTLSFSLGSDEYEVERTTGAARLYQIVSDDKGQSKVQKANGTTAVTEFIKNSLGIDTHQEFARFSYSPQGETAALLTLGAPMLNRVVEQLAGADFIDRIVNAAKAKIVFCNGKLNALPAYIDVAPHKKEKENAEARMAVIERDFSGREEDSLRITEKLSEARVCLQSVLERNKRARELHQTRTALEGSIARTTVLYDAAVARLAELGEEDPAAQDDNLRAAKERASVVRDRWTRLAELRREKESAERIVSSLADKFGKAEETKEALKKLSAKVSKDEKKYREAEDEVHACKASISRVKNALAKSECPACHRPFEVGQKEKLEAELAELEAALKKIEPIYNGLSQSLGGMQRDKLALENSLPSEREAVQMQMAKDTIESSDAKLAEVGEVTIEEVKAADDEYTALLQEVGQAKERARQRERVMEEKKRHDVELMEAKIKLAKLEVMEIEDEAPFHADEKKWLEAQSGIAAELSALQAEFSQLELSVERFSGVIEEQERAAQTRKELESKAKLLEMLSKYLTQNKARYLADIWAGIMATVTQFVSAVTSGSISAVTRDDSGDFWITEGDETRPILAASGGQRAVAGVGMRLAMGSLQPAGAGLLLLDEPSAELADETAAALAGALRTQDRQIVMVTHRSGDEFSAEQTIVLGEE